MPNKRPFRIVTAVSLFLSCFTSGSSQALAPVPSRPIRQSIISALKALPTDAVPDGSIVMTVGDKFTFDRPSPNAENPIPAPDLSTPEAIAAKFHDITNWYGHVMAIAPPTMTVLNTDPAVANLPLSELAAQHPLQFLLGSLTDSQMSQLVNDGLGLQDMTPDQQALFKAAIPHPFLIVASSAQQFIWSIKDSQKTGAEREEFLRKAREAEDEYQRQTQTLPDEMVQRTIRLRTYLDSQFSFNVSANHTIRIDPHHNEAGAFGPFKLLNDGRRSDFDNDSLKRLLSYLKAEKPNLLKPGDLNWDRRELTKTIALDGLTDVNSLVARLAAATHLELYADPRYSTLPISMVGSGKSHPSAGDLMQALCLCVAGTWRQLGSAWVLTDDIQGLGARMQLLNETTEIWSRRLTEAEQKINVRLNELKWMTTLHYAKSDVGAMSADQMRDFLKQSQGGRYTGTLVWKTLSPALQQALKGELTRTDYDDTFNALTKTVTTGLTPDTPVNVALNLRFAFDLPLTGPMLVGDPYRAQAPDRASTDVKVALPVEKIPLTERLRGVLCVPQSPEEARAIVDRLPSLGFNTVFCDVFCDGHTYFPNTVLPPKSRSEADVLQALIAEAAGKHIAVYAVMDTLCWAKDADAARVPTWPSGFAQDLTITGEPPYQVAQRRIATSQFVGELCRGWASPADSKVQAMLPKLIHSVSQTPGLAGLVFQDTATTGYLGTSQWRNSQDALGFEPENRLAFLRSSHTDPIDLCASIWLSLYSTYDHSNSSLDASIPTFGQHTDAHWNTFLNASDLTLLAACFREAHAAAPTLPLFMRERMNGLTIDPWTDQKTLDQITATDTLGNLDRPIDAQSILVVPYLTPASTNFSWFTEEVQFFRKKMGEKHADGLIVDFAMYGVHPDLLTDLGKLAPIFAP